MVYIRVKHQNSHIKNSLCEFTSVLLWMLWNMLEINNIIIIITHQFKIIKIFRSINKINKHSNKFRELEFIENFVYLYWSNMCNSTYFLLLSSLLVIDVVSQFFKASSSGIRCLAVNDCVKLLSKSWYIGSQCEIKNYLISKKRSTL